MERARRCAAERSGTAPRDDRGPSMSPPAGPDLSGLSMADLFRLEVATHGETLTTGLLSLDRAAATPEQLAAMMRAAHSVKGAARMVGCDLVVLAAHAMEDVFVAAQAGRVTIGRERVDTLLRGVDLISRTAVALDAPPGDSRSADPAPVEADITRFLAELAAP